MFFFNKENHLETSFFYTCVPKTWWYDLHFLRYRVWQTKIGNYDSFFALSSLPPLKTTKIRTLKKWKINCWRYEAQQTEFFVIFDHFLHFHPNNSKNQNFQKMKKKTPGEIIILHKCTQNHDYMLYCSWYMVYGRCNC